MIRLLRVDGRLIHGMVAVSWCGAVKPSAIVVANDRAGTDSFYAMSLKLAKPAGVEMYLYSLERAAEKLAGPKLQKQAVFLLAANLRDALYLVQNVPGIPALNIGPGVDGEEGRVSQGKTAVSPPIYLSQEEFRLAREIHDLGVEVYAQTVPTSPKIDFAEIRQKFQN